MVRGEVKIMKTLVLVFLMSMALPSGALAKKNSFAMHYGCLSIDGVPIASESDLASKCCSNEQLKDPAPSECRVGFYGTLIGALGDGSHAFDLAKAEIQQAAILAGVQGSMQMSTSRNLSSGSAPAQSSALISNGGSDGSSVSGTKEGFGVDSNEGGSAGGSAGGGNSGGGAAMGAEGLASLGSQSGKTRGVTPGDGDYSIGSYVGNPAAERKADGAAGKVTPSEGNPELLSMDPSAGGVASRGGVMGDSLSGSKEDAPDYLSRIDKNASIFKVVSKRYEREIARSRVRGVEIK